MIRHIVMWKTVARDEVGHKAQAEEVRRLLVSLVGVVPGIEMLEVGINELPGDTAADIVLMSEFADWGALKEYAIHPAHVAAADRIREITTARTSIDYGL